MDSGTIFHTVALPFLLFYAWIQHKKSAIPKWAVIAMLITALHFVGETSIDISKGIPYDWKGILYVSSLPVALFMVGYVVGLMVKIHSHTWFVLKPEARYEGFHFADLNR